jgi:electron transport complex protein RnfB
MTNDCRSTPDDVGRLSKRLHALLPQTQCTRCGFGDCAEYADAMASGRADLNRCAPGGAEGVRRLAELLHRTPIALATEYGVERPRGLARIDEDWCIGCTKCLDMCPTDAIVGAAKRMHTVMPTHCTGCELCVPVCPVDCISIYDVSGIRTGWDAWSTHQASSALARYRQRSDRLSKKDAEAELLDRRGCDISRPGKTVRPDGTPEVSGEIADSAAAHKSALVAAAMKRARSRMPTTDR